MVARLVLRVALCMLLACGMCVAFHTRSSTLQTRLACSPNSAVAVAPTNVMSKSKVLKLLLTSGSMCLSEIVDNEVVESLVEFDEDGNIMFLTPGGNGVQDIKGIWSHGRNGQVLKMIIERTYLGKFSSRTIKSHYVGLLNQQGNNLNSIIAIGKEMDLSMHDSESLINNGEITINNISDGHENGAFYLSNIILSDNIARN